MLCDYLLLIMLEGAPRVIIISNLLPKQEIPTISYTVLVQVSMIWCPSPKHQPVLQHCISERGFYTDAVLVSAEKNKQSNHTPVSIYSMPLDTYDGRFAVYCPKYS